MEIEIPNQDNIQIYDKQIQLQIWTYLLESSYECTASKPDYMPCLDIQPFNQAKVKTQ